MFIFELIFGFKIRVFIIKHFDKFINNIEYLFTVKVLADPNNEAMYFFHKQFPMMK